MTEKNIKHIKSMWAKIPPEERSRRMSELAKAKWSKTSYKDRVRHSLKMVIARENNIILKKDDK